MSACCSIIFAVDTTTTLTYSPVGGQLTLTLGFGNWKLSSWQSIDACCCMRNGIPIMVSYISSFLIIILVLGTCIFTTKISNEHSCRLLDLYPLIAIGTLVGFAITIQGIPCVMTNGVRMKLAPIIPILKSSLASFLVRYIVPCTEP